MPEERSASIAAAAAMTRRVVDDLASVGLDCAIVGGAGRAARGADEVAAVAAGFGRARPRVDYAGPRP